jgi:hypothetical protein
MFVEVGAFSGGSASVRFDHAEYIDYFGRDRSNNIRLRDGRAYYVKPAVHSMWACMEYLGYLLAADFCNVPEILPAEEVGETNEGRPSYANWIRLCQDCDPRGLPIQDLSRAVAAEVVFSAWISRSDAHNSNRCYLDGVPMFFDFNWAFGLGEASPPDFFRGGPDSGYVPNWRLVEIPPNLAVETKAIRALERGRPLTLHPVHGIERFWAAVDEFAQLISRYDDHKIERSVLACGFVPRSAERLTALLITNKHGLGERLRRIRGVMTAIAPFSMISDFRLPLGGDGRGRWDAAAAAE